MVIRLNPGDQVTALQSGKIDAICAIDGPFKPHTTKELIYSEPILFVPLYVYGRVDDNRYDNNLEKADNPDVKISVIDGDIVHDLAKLHFPKAQLLALQLLGAPGQMMQDVASKKADLLINDELSMEAYFTNNPNQLHRVNTSPLSLIPLTFSVLRVNEVFPLIDMINQAEKNLMIFGETNKIIKKYDPENRFFYKSNFLPYNQK